MDPATNKSTLSSATHSDSCDPLPTDVTTDASTQPPDLPGHLQDVSVYNTSTPSQRKTSERLEEYSGDEAETPAHKSDSKLSSFEEPNANGSEEGCEVLPAQRCAKDQTTDDQVKELDLAVSTSHTGESEDRRLHNGTCAHMTDDDKLCHEAEEKKARQISETNCETDETSDPPAQPTGALDERESDERDGADSDSETACPSGPPAAIQVAPFHEYFKPAQSLVVMPLRVSLHKFADSTSSPFVPEERNGNGIIDVKALSKSIQSHNSKASTTAWKTSAGMVPDLDQSSPLAQDPVPTSSGSSAGARHESRACYKSNVGTVSPVATEQFHAEERRANSVGLSGPRPKERPKPTPPPKRKRADRQNLGNIVESDILNKEMDRDFECDNKISNLKMSGFRNQKILEPENETD